jgi:hypothetical protein
MTGKFLRGTLSAMAACLLFAGMIFAKGTTVSIDQPARLANGPTLQPGSYKVEVMTGGPTSEVIFYKGKEIVAKAPAKLVEHPTSVSATQIHYSQRDNDRIITEMRLQGRRDRLVFEEAGETPKSGQ